MTATLLNSLLRALLRWGAALVFCLPLRHRPHFWARACGMLLPLLLLAQLLDPLAQSTTLWQQQLLLLVLYVSFFALLGGMPRGARAAAFLGPGYLLAKEFRQK